MRLSLWPVRRGSDFTLPLLLSLCAGTREGCDWLSYFWSDGSFSLLLGCWFLSSPLCSDSALRLGSCCDELYCFRREYRSLCGTFTVSL